MPSATERLHCLRTKGGTGRPPAGRAQKTKSSRHSPPTSPPGQTKCTDISHFPLPVSSALHPAQTNILHGHHRRWGLNRERRRWGGRTGVRGKGAAGDTTSMNGPLPREGNRQREAATREPTDREPHALPSKTRRACQPQRPLHATAARQRSGAAAGGTLQTAAGSGGDRGAQSVEMRDVGVQRRRPARQNVGVAPRWQLREAPGQWWSGGGHGP